MLAIRQRATSKPGPGCRLDRTHHLTRSLAFFAPFHDIPSRPVDLVSGQRSTSGTLSYVATPVGHAQAVANNSAQVIQFPNQSWLDSLAAPFTVLVLARHSQASVGGFQGVIGGIGSNARFFIGLDFSRNLYFSTTNGSDAVSSLVLPASARRFSTIATTYNGSQAVIYLDGQTQSISYSTVSSSTSNNIRIGGNAGGNNFPGDIAMAAVWQRVLSKGELDSLRSNPWQFLIPASHRSFFLDIGIGGGSSNATFNATALGLTSAIQAGIYSGAANIAPSVLALTKAVQAPATSGSSLILPSALSATTANQAPTISGAATITDTAKTLTVANQSHSIVAGGNVTVTPAEVADTMAVIDPASYVMGVAVDPTNEVMQIATHSVTISAGIQFTPVGGSPKQWGAVRRRIPARIKSGTCDVQPIPLNWRLIGGSAFADGAGAPRSIDKRQRATVTTGGGTLAWRNTPLGVGYEAAPLGGSHKLDMPCSTLDLSKPYTVALYLTFREFQTVSPRIQGLWASDSSGTTMIRTGDNLAGSQDNIQFVTNTTTKLNGTINLGLHRPHLIVATNDLTTARLYIDGRPDVFGTPAAMTGTLTNTVLFRDNQAAGRGPNVIMHAFYLWQRALSASDVEDLWLRPFSPIMPDRVRTIPAYNLSVTDRTMNPPAFSVPIAFQAPVTSAAATTTPAVLTATEAVQSTTLVTGVTATPAAFTVVDSLQGPAISVGGSITISTAAVGETVALQAPAPSTSTVRTVAAVTATAAVQSPTLSGAATYLATAFGVSETLRAPVISGATAVAYEIPTRLTGTVSVKATEQFSGLVSVIDTMIDPSRTNVRVK